MSTPIIATKLYVPTSRPKVVPRIRLVEQLNKGLHRKLTLISAPAGFGKTTLVSEWITGIQRPTAWLSLDAGDNDLNHFLAYLIAALQTLTPNLGERVLEILQGPPPVPTEPLLTALLNEIAAIPDNFILVLDDYHVIDAEPVDEALTFLINHLPPQMHIIIATRENPGLPLARLRVRDQLTELRVSDLRFVPSEVAVFLNNVMGLNLSAEEISALETRTEGWIAGLQLAALALQGQISMQQGQQHFASFIQSFTGSHHFVLDYLVEEILQQQPESVQTFLLHTSILDRLCGSLCDFLISDFGPVLNNAEGMQFTEPTVPQSLIPNLQSQAVLEQLERANLLVVPLDDRRQWYRYHHLFADALQARLKKEQPKQVANLHRRACDWYKQNDLRSDAIHHALAAEDFEQAADLIELEWSVIRRSCFRSPTWLGWVKSLPDDLVRSRPVLCVGFAWELLNFGELEAAEAQLKNAERWLKSKADMNMSPKAGSARPGPSANSGQALEGMIVANEEELPSLRGMLATVRAYHAQALGDAPGTVKHAWRALALVSEADYYTCGMASLALGFASWTGGDLKSAHRFIADGMVNLQKAGNILFTLWGTIALADIRMAQGRFHEAISKYEHALQLTTEQSDPVIQGTASLHLGLSDLYLEFGDLEAAKQCLLKGEELGEQTGLPDWRRRLCLIQARVKQSQGDLAGALDLFNEAERLYYNVPFPDVRPIAALKTRVWVAQGKLKKALAWARERGLSADDELSYLREFEHITLARVLIAQYRGGLSQNSIHEATELLDRLLKTAEAGERKGSVIEILLLQALAHQAHGDITAALMPLQRALTLAEPEGYVRIFINEGLPMANLLNEAFSHGITPDYTQHLLAALSPAESQQADFIVTQSTFRTPHSAIAEPLSKRELDVLRLLGTELNGPEIARELMISLNTMRTHTKNIYNKLGVNNRRTAVRRAQELNLL